MIDTKVVDSVNVTKKITKKKKKDKSDDYSIFSDEELQVPIIDDKIPNFNETIENMYDFQDGDFK